MRPLKQHTVNNNIPVVDVAWAAGLLEGEGNFLASVYNRKDRPNVDIQVRVSAVSTDIDVLEKLKDIFGVGYIRVHDDGETNPKWKPSWRWVVGARADALQVGRLIYPFMCTRRAIAIRKMFDIVGEEL